MNENEEVIIVNEEGRIKRRQPFILSNEDIKALHEYFYQRAGYISYNFDLSIIQLIRRLDAYLHD